MKAPLTKTWSQPLKLSFYFLSAVLLFCIGFLGHVVVQREMEEMISSDLVTALNTDKEAVQLWVREQKRLANSWSQESIVKQNALELARYAARVNYDHTLLLHSPELGKLREKLKPVVDQYNLIGFVIFDITGRQVGALLDEPVGQARLAKLSDFVRRSLEGKTVVSVPFKGEVPLPGPDGVYRKDWPTMFVSAPIWDQNGEVAGVLAFRIRPESSFTRVLELTRKGKSGEAYAFNRDGIMVTDSRFNDQLRKLRLISDHPDSRAILNIKLLDPSPNENLKSSKNESTELKELTHMAQGALKGESGVNIDGYHDYRGVLVVGAWTWLPELNVGLAVEQDLEEAYEPLISLRTVLFSIFILLGGVTTVALVLRARQTRIEKHDREMQEAWERERLQNQAILNSTPESIITIDTGGIVQSANPAVETMFGYQLDELIGQNINVLMPEPYKSDHPGILQSLAASGREEVFLVSRDLPGLKKDGREFPIELTVTSMVLNGKIRYLGVIRDVSEKKLADQKLERLHRNNQLILASVGDGIYGVDLEGKVTFVNPAAAKMVGYPSRDMIGKNQHIIIHHTKPDGSPYPLETCPIYSTFTDGKVCHISDEVFWRNDGTSFPVEYISNPIIEDGQVVGAVVSFQDITERKKTEEAIRRYARDLEKVNEELSNFTSVATHDLQEPLRKVITLSDRLKMTQGDLLDDKGRDYLNRILNSVQRMQRLIYDLLEYARTTSRDSMLERVSMDEEVALVLSDLEVTLEETGGVVEVGPLPTLEFNRMQMRRLMQNLVSNAIKFSRPGVPPVVKISASQNKSGQWVIQVSDNGIGFDKKYLDRIFKPFQRLQSREDYEGSGIGLAICEKIVTSHHGEIFADSQPGKGSQFFITLPENQTP